MKSAGKKSTKMRIGVELLFVVLSFFPQFLSYTAFVTPLKLKSY